MCLTDRSVIASFNRPAASEPTRVVSTTTDETTVTPQSGHSATAGSRPHFVPGASGKQPLSALMGARRSEAAVEAHAAKPRATSVRGDSVGFALDAFTWPPVARELAARLAGELAPVLKHATRRVLAVVGAEPRVGATTLTLALSLAASHLGRQTMLVDAAQQAALAAALGVRTLPPLGGAPSSDPLRGRTVRGENDRTTLASAGTGFTQQHAEAIADKAEEHLILVDAGAARADRASGVSAVRWTPWSTVADFLVVDTPAATRRRAAIDALCSSGVAPIGVIENTARAA